ncbi:MAG TPA: HAD family phosphatase [Candidatus Angelobacter sp.]
MPKAKTKMPAVLFDLDGTLIDSVYEHVQAWWRTLRSAGVFVPKWMIHRRVGMSGKSFVEELLREFAPKKEINIEQLEKEHDAKILKVLSDIPPLRGADDLLKHLHRSRIRIAIATTGNRKQTALLLKKLTIPRGMPILTGDDVKKAKPSPDIFVAAAAGLKVQLRDCIVVGDSVWDVLAAGRKSALSVGMLSGGYGDEELHRAGAFRIYSDPRDMLLHLEQLGLPG